MLVVTVMLAVRLMAVYLWSEYPRSLFMWVGLWLLIPLNMKY